MDEKGVSERLGEQGRDGLMTGWWWGESVRRGERWLMVRADEWSQYCEVVVDSGLPGSGEGGRSREMVLFQRTCSIQTG